MRLAFRRRISLAIAAAVLLAVPSGPIAAADSPGSSSPARAMFERFRKLEGHWTGRSTRGWKDTVSFKTIAAGSVVVENSFDAHPGETMMTMYAMEGANLTLTHYCVAKNQPHLRATEFSDDGRSVTFTFDGGGNLADRNRGHMDKASFRFEDDDHVTTRWTWYQDGTEKWLEEIRMERAR